VYSYLMANDDEVGRVAMAQKLRRLTGDVSPMCPEEPLSKPQAPEHGG
jgi:hypothetical protein